jgi:phage terminase large subunit
VQGWKMYVTKDSIDLIKELRNYTWDKDKDGNPLNQPIDKWNHLADALRYALFSKFAQKAGYGHYSIGFINRRR